MRKLNRHPTIIYRRTAPALRVLSLTLLLLPQATMADAIVRGSGSNDSFTSRPLHDYKTAAACGQQPCTSSKVKRYQKMPYSVGLKKMCTREAAKVRNANGTETDKIVPPEVQKSCTYAEDYHCPGESVLTGWRLKFDGNHTLYQKTFTCHFLKLDRAPGESIQKNLCRSTQLSAANENAEFKCSEGQVLDGLYSETIRKALPKAKQTPKSWLNESHDFEEKKAGRCCSIIANDNAAQPERRIAVYALNTCEDKSTSLSASPINFSCDGNKVLVGETWTWDASAKKFSYYTGRCCALEVE